MKLSRLSLVAAVVLASLTGGIASAQYPTYPPPQYPVYHAPPTFNGYTPWGGANTKTTTVYSGAYDPYRDISKHIGNTTAVSRPVYDAYGRVVGWEAGRQWYNPFTGQVHFDTTTATRNATGGYNLEVRSGDSEEE